MKVDPHHTSSAETKSGHNTQIRKNEYRELDDEQKLRYLLIIRYRQTRINLITVHPFPDRTETSLDKYANLLETNLALFEYFS